MTDILLDDEARPDEDYCCSAEATATVLASMGLSDEDGSELETLVDLIPFGRRRPRHCPPGGFHWRPVARHHI